LEDSSFLESLLPAWEPWLSSWRRRATSELAFCSELSMILRMLCLPSEGATLDSDRALSSDLPFDTSALTSEVIFSCLLASSINTCFEDLGMSMMAGVAFSKIFSMSRFASVFERAKYSS